jgi:thymidylate synthase (FAD)
MRILKPRWLIESNISDTAVSSMIQLIERCGRTCYKSEDKITPDSARAFLRMITDRKHLSVFDHVFITVRFQFDRGISHQMVRQRIGAGYSQESTRYCNYSKAKFGGEISVIKPNWLTGEAEHAWYKAVLYAENRYFEMLSKGVAPQIARSVLPTCLKTEIATTYDFTAWRHFFEERTAPDAHPQIREVARPLLAAFRRVIPVVFDDVGFANSPYEVCPECGSTEQPGDLPDNRYPSCLTCQWVGGYRPKMDWIQLENERSEKARRGA